MTSVKTAIDISSGRTAALDNNPNPGAALPTVLLVPGYTGSKEDFLPLLRPLADAGFHGVAIDQRGQYESTWANDPAGYRIEALGADILEIADAVAGDATELHLLGHSFGGLVARAAVLAKAERFTSLTLMGSGPAEIGGQRRQTMQAAEPILAEHGIDRLWEHIAEQSRADPKYRHSPPALLEFMRARFVANDPVGLQVMGRELQQAPDLTAELAETNIPMLVLHGVDDDAWPPSVQGEMAAQLGAGHAVIPAAAHSPAVENPSATLRALLDFWRLARH
jgi:pimeloyl-ACP methyl ester carboxylesterase